MEEGSRNEMEKDFVMGKIIPFEKSGSESWKIDF